MDAPTTIAWTVRHTREQMHLTQDAAATLAGISRRAWSEIELGQRRGSPDTLRRVAGVLGLPEDSLAATTAEVGDPDLAAIKNDLLGLAKLLTTEDPSPSQVERTLRRVKAIRAELDEYEQVLRRDRGPRP